MGLPLETCEEALEKAIVELFDADPRIQAVGIARHEHAFGFKAIQNVAKVLPSAASRVAKKPPKHIQRVPVTIESVMSDIEIHSRVPFPLATTLVPEQQLFRPIVCGLQVENVDDDDRQRKAGQLGSGFMIVGTLGCFVKLAAGATAILSNNHVLAGENRGQNGKDRILQPGHLTFVGREHIATLSNFVKLNPSPNNARPAKGNVIYNEVDAAVAELRRGVQFSQSYLPARNLIDPQGILAPHVGDKVLKVGRTTGLTHGTITAIGTVVGPIAYDPGPCWFKQQIEIVGDNGTLFSDHGDSGSAIVSTTGEVVGLLYAGNGKQTYACPIQTALSALTCALA